MKILSFDVETNGLMGNAFAVGAILMDLETLAIEDSFQGKGHPLGDIPDFVKENVLPAIKDLTQYQSNAYMRYAFWNFYRRHSRDGYGSPRKDVLVIADVGFPVETSFIRLCMEDAGDTWGGPYPLHEAATLFLALGLDTDFSRLEYGKQLHPKDSEFTNHNPLHDATVSAYAIAKAMAALRLHEPVIKGIVKPEPVVDSEAS